MLFGEIWGFFLGFVGFWEFLARILGKSQNSDGKAGNFGEKRFFGKSRNLGKKEQGFGKRDKIFGKRGGILEKTGGILGKSPQIDNREIRR